MKWQFWKRRVAKAPTEHVVQVEYKKVFNDQYWIAINLQARWTWVLKLHGGAYVATDKGALQLTKDIHPLIYAKIKEELEKRAGCPLGGK